MGDNRSASRRGEEDSRNRGRSVTMFKIFSTYICWIHI